MMNLINMFLPCLVIFLFFAYARAFEYFLIIRVFSLQFLLYFTLKRILDLTVSFFLMYFLLNNKTIENF